MGLAFADELVGADASARLTIVDRRTRPGGHWTDAYPFVALHQPAAFYGVGSEQLGTGGGDLSSRAELLAYFERAMSRLTGSGRVRFMAGTEYLGDNRVRNLATGREDEIEVRRRLVDATYMDVQVPATHPPRFEVDPDAKVVPPNALTELREPYPAYVVVGSGKTGCDAAVHLLDRGIEPLAVTLISPSDMWIWNREVVQPHDVPAELTRQLEAVARADTIAGLFLDLERQGSFSRLDSSLLPAKWRCATMDRRERDQLGRIERVVRAGRVERVGADEIELEQGSIPLAPGTLVVNCTANGLAAREPVPIFGPGRITLQSIFECQQVFSAAAIGRLATTALNDEERNRAVSPVPHPQLTSDFPGALAQTVANELGLARRIPRWMATSRLHLFAHGPKLRSAKALVRARMLLPRLREATARLS